jgi:hypothetical protein
MTPLAKIPIFGHPPSEFCTPLITFQASLRAGRKSVRDSIAIFAFLFRYFFSTRPNEFFQIQAYLITDFDQQVTARS